jgi:hypothetical protein
MQAFCCVRQEHDDWPIREAQWSAGGDAELRSARVTPAGNKQRFNHHRQIRHVLDELLDRYLKLRPPGYAKLETEVRGAGASGFGR